MVMPGSIEALTTIISRKTLFKMGLSVLPNQLLIHGIIDPSRGNLWGNSNLPI